MFIQNKYYRWYNDIIEKSQNRILDEYYENHHIVPRSLGGNNDNENIASLTAREHFICHVLLTKFTSGPDRHKMLYAANMMSQIKRDYQYRYIPKSKIYEMIKREFGILHSKKLKGKKLSDAHKFKISEGGKGRINSAETIEKRRQSCIGKKRTPEQKERMRQAQLNRKERTLEEKLITAQKASMAHKGKKLGPKSEEHKAKLSAIFKGKKTGPRSEETKQKMRKPKTEAHCKAISEGRKKRYQKI